MTVLGLDIGGANIKAATSGGRHLALPFPLWKHPERLKETVAGIRDRWPDVERLALTMTGELADCFATKSDGVAHIVDAAVSIGLPVDIWTTDGRFVPPDEARQQPMRVAAANWHALATWAARQHPLETGLLIDIGSTTTDLIPFCHGIPVAAGQTDVARLQSGELLYSGIRRTPLCAVRPEVELAGQTTPLAAEWFATMLDVYVWLGGIPEDAEDCDTADGRPATRRHTWDRLAHAVCCDRDELSAEQITEMAHQLAQTQRNQIQVRIDRIGKRLGDGPTLWVTSGSGEFVAERVLAELAANSGGIHWSLTQHLGAGVAECACAFAVSQLAQNT